MSPPVDKSTADDAGEPSDRLFKSILAASLCRVLLNTARRFAYPFAPVLSRGLEVNLTAVTSLIAVNQATGVVAMFFGPLADRLGYRLMMMAAMGMLTVGMLASGFLPFFGVVMASLFLAGLGKNIFDPSIQAYAGERIPYERRGLIIGILEFSWAGSTLIGVPLMGLLIDRFGWQSPFFALAVGGFIGFLSLMTTIGGNRPKTGASASAGNLWEAWRLVLRRREALGALGFGFFISIANDNLFVVYGVWLEQSFSLSIVALGLGTGLIGLAELVGEIMTAALADRIGLKAAVGGGLVASMIGYLTLPMVGLNVLGALVGLFIVFLVFEFTMVCFLSLSTELIPAQRATMMSIILAAAGMGRVVGALIGGPVWMAGGILATSVASALISALGLVFLFWGLSGWRPA